jgi:ATP:ADP antiporter, AAA family
LLFAVLGLLGIVDKRARAAASSGNAAPPPLGKEGGFSLVLRDRYLFLIGVMLVLANFINTSGEFILSTAAKVVAKDWVAAWSAFWTNLAASAPEPLKTAINPTGISSALAGQQGEVIGNFYGDFFFFVNGVGLVIQTFLASRVIKYAGIRSALFVMPAIALAGYGAIGLVGGLTLIRIAKTAENSVDYSLQNTVRQSLFLPTSREVKYKAKAAIDTFFVRFGDAAAAVVVLVGVKQAGFDATTIAFINAGVVLVWLAVAAGIAKGHKRLEAKGMPEAKVAK